MKRRKQRVPPWWFSQCQLGGKVAHYRDKQNIYKQGAPAYTLFYIQEGGVRLTTRRNINHRPLPRSWARMIFWRALPRGYPFVFPGRRVTASSIRTIKKEKMLQILRKKNKTSNSWWPICCPASKLPGSRGASPDFLCGTKARARASAASHLNGKGPRC